MKRNKFILVFLLFFFLFVDCSFALKTIKHSSDRAISLRVLQDQLISSKQNKRQDLIHLAGITNITGYVIDQVNKDVILIGDVDNSQPKLFLEDFILALRNAWWQYTDLKGNTQYYSYPGCSIDPVSDVMKKLQDVASKFYNSSSTEQIENSIEEWNDICGSQQKVSVLGIPFHTHFAKVMVKADYDMKSLVDGSDSLNIPNFSSLVDMKLNLIKNASRNGKSPSISLTSTNRFWYYPGENLYVEDDGVLLIGKCQVVLLTEEEFVTSTGQTVGTGQSDPLAQRFSQNYSSLYSEIAQLRPIYKELENLFRFVALAKILKFKSVLEEADLSLEYLFNHIEIPQDHVTETVPGRHSIKRLEHKRELTNGYQTIQLWLPSCGGVDIRIEPSTQHFKKINTSELIQLKEKVIEARPTSEALMWDYPLKGREE